MVREKNRVIREDLDRTHPVEKCVFYLDHTNPPDTTTSCGGGALNRCHASCMSVAFSMSNFC